MGRPEDDLAHPRALLVPCMLLLLAESPSHGYDLIERLKDFGFDWGGPGPIYAELRRLADAELISSAWAHPAAGGPARRVYEPNAAALAALDGCAEGIGELGRFLGEFLRRYRMATARGERAEAT